MRPDPSDFRPIADYLRDHAVEVSYQRDRATANGDHGLALGLRWRHDFLLDLAQRVESWTMPVERPVIAAIRAVRDVFAA